MEELKPYYQGLIDKYIPGHLKWSTDTGARIACMCARVYGASPRDVCVCVYERCLLPTPCKASRLGGHHNLTNKTTTNSQLGVCNIPQMPQSH